MSRLDPSLLTRLRRHRGLWALALLVLLIKLASSTLCMTDGLGGRAAVAAATSVSLSVLNTTDQGNPAADGACVLGEAGDCHCACAHATTLPSTATLAVHAQNFRTSAPMFETSLSPAPTSTLLRPPIA